MLKNEKGISAILVVLLVIVLLIILTIGGLAIWYNSSIKAVQANSEKVVIEIEGGSGISGIADALERNNLIKNATAFKVYCKLNKETSMQAGKYELDKNMNVEQIINELKKGNVVDETVKITFIEGKNIRWIAKTIEENTDNTEEDVYNLLQDDEYLDSIIEKYWFISDDIKDDDIYYSLEGYLYPDTYILADKTEDVKTIFGRMLDRMDNALTPYKDEIKSSKYSVHELLALASVIELEAKNEEDRGEVAGVFYNRLNKKMPLQSDVTTYYSLKLDMDERDLTAKELASNNPYNTSASTMAGKLPVGPICMVSEVSIKAAIEPNSTDKIFFVADKNGKLYFSKTNSEHEAQTKKLKEEGLWYTYE